MHYKYALTYFQICRVLINNKILLHTILLEWGLGARPVWGQKISTGCTSLASESLTCAGWHTKKLKLYKNIGTLLHSNKFHIHASSATWEKSTDASQRCCYWYYSQIDLAVQVILPILTHFSIALSVCLSQFITQPKAFNEFTLCLKKHPQHFRL